jgi:hypothetical protein
MSIVKKAKKRDLEFRQYYYLLIFWFGLTNTESETNPNNNLMMGQAGLS